MSQSINNVRIVLAQINLLVGDIAANTRHIIESIKSGIDEHAADLIVFPELSITSYPPEDLLYRPELHNRVKQALIDISTAAKGIDVVIGYPELIEDKLYNASCLIRSGNIEKIYHKQILPNYGVFDEKRYFKSGNDTSVFEIKEIPIVMTICEDIWESGPCAKAAAIGAKLMININASPFHTKKTRIREEILRQRVAESKLNIIYVNLVGGQDELIFDGDSIAINNKGEIQFHAPRFQEGLYSIEFSCDNGGHFTVPAELNCAEQQDEEIIYQALVLGVKDYVRKNGFQGAIIGLSGGIDSALTLCIAVDALGKKNVGALMMPSRYTANISIEDATSQAEALDIKYNIISIEKLVEAFDASLQNYFTDLPPDTTEENIQARCRGTLLMAVSNKTGKLVLATGNKSEMAVGYATLYGDMAGGFAPLKDIPKTMVYKLANWRNQQRTVIPQRVIDRPPTAELRENQTDEDSLPPYDVLDPILERYIELDQSPEKIIDSGFDENIVHMIVSLVDHNEYKRRQSAPGIRISQRAFGRDRRYPITSGYRE